MAECSPGDPAWLQPGTLDLCALLLASHQRSFGRPLIPGRGLRLLAQELFTSEQMVLAHGCGSDPCLTYANRAALWLWGRPWAVMVGMPSRLTAAPQERVARAQALDRARADIALRGYSGIRIDRQGRRFRIRNARLWCLRDAGGHDRGQAACFSDWCWIDPPPESGAGRFPSLRGTGNRTW